MLSCARRPDDFRLLTDVNLVAGSPELEELAGQLLTMLEDTASANQDFLTLLDAGASVSMRYRTPDGTEALRVDVHPADCGF